MVVAPMEAPRHEAAALFNRLPADLFGPLASPNRAGYWKLLCHLHREMFGPEAPVPPSDGFPQRDVCREIESILVAEAQWQDESTESQVTPTQRATSAYYRLRDSGWLHESRLGARQMVVMRPIVADFLGRLIEFAEKGPSFVGGKVRSIHLNLTEVASGRASGESLTEAAEQARNLLRFVAATGSQVRELMDELRTSHSVAEFTARFFTDYIQRIFIGDYSELRTKDHPLVHRSSIVEIARRLSEEMPERILAWYRDKAAGGNELEGIRLFERDISRILALNQLEQYLSRLDQEVDRANRKALAYIDYRLRTPNRVGAIVLHAIKCLQAMEGTAARPLVPFPAGRLLSPQSLKDPREVSAPISPSPIRSRQLSPHAMALQLLHTRALRARAVGPVQIASYLARHVNHQSEYHATDLTINSIEDFCAYQALLTLAFRAKAARNRMENRSSSNSILPAGMSVQGTDERVDNGYISSHAFVVRRSTEAQK